MGDPDQWTPPPPGRPRGSRPELLPRLLPPALPAPELALGGPWPPMVGPLDPNQTPSTPLPPRPSPRPVRRPPPELGGGSLTIEGGRGRYHVWHKGLLRLVNAGPHPTVNVYYYGSQMRWPFELPSIDPGQGPGAWPSLFILVSMRSGRHGGPRCWACECRQRRFGATAAASVTRGFGRVTAARVASQQPGREDRHRNAPRARALQCQSRRCDGPCGAFVVATLGDAARSGRRRMGAVSARCAGGMTATASVQDPGGVSVGSRGTMKHAHI